ncbi:hypothetical protein BUALT_Bualt07G0177100 [Buddleja alternifolia]|uniref:Uncharacterized protein n=1 Tax=Buddleja alternifolia TaxID=168488 RepID=A0AAV6XJU3_9LAMI|nr:hypothetical protein BUALT_Bualt07G0177100 [Buddleja alternifolia]
MKSQSSTLPNQAPGLSSPAGGKMKYISPDDLEFDQRLQAVRKLALEQKKAEEVKEYGVIDYDTPTESESSTIGLGTKRNLLRIVASRNIAGLPDEPAQIRCVKPKSIEATSVSPTEEAATVDAKISEEERANLEKRLKQFEETLEASPEDSTALEGAAVTLAEMREYKRAATLLDKLTEKKPSDPDAFRLLGEVKYELKDYKGSVVAYKSAERASKNIDFEILRGLTNSLLAAKKPDEAVQVLLASRERLNKEKSSGNSDGTVSISDVDPIQVSSSPNALNLQYQVSPGQVVQSLKNAAVSHLMLIERCSIDRLIIDYISKLSRQASGEGMGVTAHLTNFDFGLGLGVSSSMTSNSTTTVDLLLGKAYSDWGHISDAVAVYDKLISSHPDDFRGYLAKGIILKENGSVGDAERMFIQARFFAPDKAKVVVDKFLSLPDFRVVMEKAAEEFGYEQQGGLRIPCDEHDFQILLATCSAP